MNRGKRIALLAISISLLFVVILWSIVMSPKWGSLGQVLDRGDYEIVKYRTDVVSFDPEDEFLLRRIKDGSSPVKLISEGWALNLNDSSNLASANAFSGRLYTFPEDSFSANYSVGVKSSIEDQFIGVLISPDENYIYISRYQ